VCQQVLDGDGQFAGPVAGGVVDRIGDRGGGADLPDFADGLDAQRAGDHPRVHVGAAEQVPHLLRPRPGQVALMNPGAAGGVPMIPPSANSAPPARTTPATSRARSGDTALASTYSPPNPAPATSRATSRAACGGQTENTTSERAAISPIPAAFSPAASARSRVAGLRP